MNIQAVTKEFNEFQSSKIEDKLVTLQQCMEASMKDLGWNRYKQPHMNKKPWHNAGEVISNVLCDSTIYNLARNLVNEPQKSRHRWGTADGSINYEHEGFKMAQSFADGGSTP